MNKQPLIWFLLAFSVVGALVSWALVNDQKRLYREGKDLPEVLHLVDLAYVDRIDMGELMPGVFQGALERLDENASYLPPGAEPNPNLANEAYRRTGLTVIKRHGYAFALAVAADSPAWRAGVRPGDYLRELDGLTTREMSAYRVRRLLVETESLPVVFLRGEDGEERKAVIEPGRFEPSRLNHVRYADGVHLIQAPNFYPNWAAELRKAIDEAVEAKAELLLDLRNNAMGGEAELVELAALFFGAGPVLARVDAAKQKTLVLNGGKGAYAGTPFYILMDETTSRAAELFGAAAQDREAAVILGAKSLGNATRYQFVPLKNGGFIEIATERAVLNSGRKLTGEGVDPNVDLTAEESAENSEGEILSRALEQVRRAKAKKAA